MEQTFAVAMLNTAFWAVKIFNERNFIFLHVNTTELVVILKV